MEKKKRPRVRRPGPPSDFNQRAETLPRKAQKVNPPNMKSGSQPYDFIIL
jgi:hypothetical protein